MSVLIGTQDGVYRSTSGEFDDVQRVLDAGVTLGVHTFEGHGSFVASKTGLYQSVDGGITWTRLSVPQTEVYAVAVSPDGSRLYAGTHPAHLYVSTDEGRSWRELTGFQALPSRRLWHTPRHRGVSHVRSLGVHPDAPSRLVAGVEVGGVHVSDDYGETWTERRDDLRTDRQDDLQYDVHHVLVITPEEYVISCGGGLYRTVDTGHSWNRLAVDPFRTYFQESFYYRRKLYATAQTHPPGLPMGDGHSDKEVNAAIFESRDQGKTFWRQPYPGNGDEFVYAWMESDGRVFAGTTSGRVITRNEHGWTTVGHVPQWIRSMSNVEGDK